MVLSDFFKGWLVGDFEPALFNSKDVEVGVKEYKANDYEPNHVHKLVLEYTVVLTGKVEMNGVVYEKGSIIKVEPNKPTDFRCLEDSITLVIKTPSIPTDKHLL